ncbi:hypothetical protein CYLTODRAFT_344448 [Cylindrobasidium torrendii FP15055 ss-10]|uniref:ribonuclease H n=1 Tax=Cylindrobasidium torrendii FP15055 ss-10 TaxID=1314674 RepID=A0A0D7BPU1_9AGAR|nr:hypothetical protein CYLTODRAFT_344448 [Cylindrobasidium torrendii FP15055 ss-10]
MPISYFVLRETPKSIQFPPIRIPPNTYSKRRFEPPNADDKPTTIFAPENNNLHAARFVRRSNWQEALIYAAGACTDNEHAGCAFIFHPNSPKQNVQFSLEIKGPFNEEHPQSQDRATLRAVLGALTFREWDGEGFRRVVIATDSEYVVLGLTELVYRWRDNGWVKSSGTPVENRDLWEALLERLHEVERRGTQPLFWLITKQQNAATRMAEAAADNWERTEHFTLTWFMHKPWTM